MARKYKEIAEGDVFGLLTVVDANISQRSGKRFHKCLCDCGNIVEVRDDSLKSSGSKSCGCSSKKALEEYRTEKLFKVGDAIGDCEVLSVGEYRTSASVLKCFCGNEFNAHLSSFKKRKNKSCGCVLTKRESGKKICGFGINDLESAISHLGEKCPYYIKWTQMLHRCYSINRMKTHPTYLGTAVSEDWLYFSNFKSWMERKIGKVKN